MSELLTDKDIKEMYIATNRFVNMLKLEDPKYTKAVINYGSLLAQRLRYLGLHNVSEKVLFYTNQLHT